MPALAEIFPDSKDLLALTPEDLGAVLMEVLPSSMQSSGVSWFAIEQALYPDNGPEFPGYHRHDKGAVNQALTEALSWLQTQGLIIVRPDQTAVWYRITRRGQELKTRTDVSTYMLGRTLPIDLLQPELAEKVHHLYLRGDYEVAVFQAFKLVETAVRDASKLGADEIGVRLMRKAFDPKTGPLTINLPGEPEGEKQAVSDLFAGAIGYAKNPASHREVRHTRESAARLILFAAELLDVLLTHHVLGG